MSITILLLVLLLAVVSLEISNYLAWYSEDDNE